MGASTVLTFTNTCSYSGGVERLAAHDLERLKRSAAMLAPGQTMPIGRNELYGLLAEVLELRALVTRLGADMTTAAKIARGQG